MFPIQFKGETYYYKQSHKVCTKCGENKPYTDYNVAFVKASTNYNPVLKPKCRECNKAIVKKYRSRIFIVDGKEMNYCNKYYTLNKEKCNKDCKENYKNYRDNLKDSYIAQKISDSFGITRKEAYQNTELMELKRASILTSRIIKKIKNSSNELNR